jgi:hypothetical protein
MTKFFCKIILLPCALFALNHAPASTATGAPSPIALNEYNADIVTDANTALRFATAADIGTADWFEAGAIDDNGVQHSDGLTAGNFTSAFTNSVTGGHTVFQLQPFNHNNSLLLKYPSSNTGTLSFATPKAYNTLAILAAGYNAAPGSTGTVIINFADSTQSQSLLYNAFDWGFGQTNFALSDKGRNFNNGPSGTEFHYNKPVPFAMYETDLDLAALGLNAKPISSLTFTGIIGTTNFPHASIFAVSATAVPEPSSIVVAALGCLGLAYWRRLSRNR